MFAFHDLLDRVRKAVVSLAHSAEAHYQLTVHLVEGLDRIETKVDSIVAREQVSWELYQSRVADLVDGFKSVQAENTALRAQVDSLGKSTQDRINKAVNEALAEDSEHDANRIDAAIQALPVIEHGSPIPPKPVDATPQTTENGSHDVPGPDGTPVTVGPDSDSDDAPGGDSVADPDDASNETTEEDPETTTDPAVNSGDDSGDTATTSPAADGSAEEQNGGDITGRQSGR